MDRRIPHLRPAHQRPDATAAAPSDPSDAIDAALFGRDPMPRLVDVQPLMDRPSSDPARVRLYQRSDDFQQVIEHEDRLYPFFFISDITLLQGRRDTFKFTELDGDNFFRNLVIFDTWSDYWDAVRQVERLTDSEESRPDELYLVGSPAQQYLMQTGRTCFLDMTVDDLHRMQLDIEVYSEHGFPSAERPEDEIIIVALRDNRGWDDVLYLRDGIDERRMLEDLVHVIRERDPDVIEGYNCFAFDFDYILKRCQRHGVDFAIGRDGSTPRTYDSSMRFAERTVDYPAMDVAGRHVIDVYFQVMAFDVFKRDLPDYSLKTAAKYFGFAPEDRTYVAGEDIAAAWREDRDRLLEYALDDVIETGRLARHLSGSTFYLTQMLPMTYGASARRGPASKIESLFVREYLRKRHALPRSQWGSQSMGGYTDIFIRGVLGPVVYADVESLYPSIMLNYDVQPDGDTLDLFPQLLDRLTTLRLKTKQDMKDADDEEVRSELDARQSSYKVLINCFDPETDVVTVNGVKNIRDVAVGDLVYSLHPETGEVQIKPVVATQMQHYDGPMVEIKNRHVDFLVTPNHRFLTQKFTSGRYTDLAWETAADILDDRIRRLPELRPLPGTDPDRDSIWVQALCDRHGIEYKSGTRGIKELRQQGRWHPNEYTVQGDGDKAGDRYTTSSDALAEDVQRPAAHVGRRVMPMTNDGSHRLQVNFVRGQRPTIKPHQRRKVDYSGTIHCLTVADNHTVLAGRNNRFNWCGQSFYGLLGFGLSAFNDFEEADRVARTGQQILRQLIDEIRERGGDVIEVDTDGVLFVPPEDVRGEDEEIAFTRSLTEAMPDGIRVGFDGRFKKMLSYKKKNYALLTYEDDLKFKGSSLISRSNEAFGRRFVREAIRLMLDHDVDGLHDLYVTYREKITAHDWKGVESFSRVESLKDSLDQYEDDVESGQRPRAAAYELARKRSEETGQPVRKGDRIRYYITGDSANVTAFQNCKLAEEWDPEHPDENTAYYLKRLDQFAQKFEPFFEEHDFRLIFSPEDLFGFSSDGIEIQTTRLEADEPATDDADDEVPF